MLKEKFPTNNTEGDFALLPILLHAVTLKKTYLSTFGINALLRFLPLKSLTRYEAVELDACTVESGAVAALPFSCGCYCEGMAIQLESRRGPEKRGERKMRATNTCGGNKKQTKSIIRNKSREVKKIINNCM